MASHHIEVTDYFGSREAASTLVAQIVSYWTKLGYHGVEAWVEATPTDGRGAYAVRSNIHNGFPPKQPAKRKADPSTLVPPAVPPVADPPDGQAWTEDTTTFSQSRVISVALPADEVNTTPMAL